MTAAEVVKPPAAPAETTRRIPAGIRLTWLHLRCRHVPTGVLVLAVCGGVLRAELHWHWAFSSGPYAQQVPMIIEAGAAAVIAVTVYSPRPACSCSLSAAHIPASATTVSEIRCCGRTVPANEIPSHTGGT